MNRSAVPQHEQLDAYQTMLALIPEVAAASRAVPPLWGDIGDQLRRAASSVLLNIAEGAGEFSSGDKAHSYRIARRSATECMAALDVIAVLRPEATGVAALKVSLNRVASMLTGLVKAVESRDP